MLYRILISLLVFSLTASFVFAIKQCNQTHPDYDDNSCRRLKTPENRLHNYLLKYKILNFKLFPAKTCYLKGL